MDVQTWAVKLLQGLGYQPTRGAVRGLVGWAHAEGGNWNNDASFNPLNTTLNAPGARSINGVGVKAYRSWDEGLGATIKTLKNGHYGGILQALKTGDAGALANAVGNSPWGTNASLIHSTIASTHIGRIPHVVPTPGGAGPGSSGGLGQELAPPPAITAPQPQQPQITPVSVPPPPTAPAPALPKAYRPLDPGSAPAPPAPADITLQGVNGPTAPGGGGQAGGAPVAPATRATDSRLESILKDANKVDAAHVPYLWGGGHQAKQIRGSHVLPMDCSGAVSRVLGVNPRVAAQFEKWGKAGEGKHVTIYANDDHVLLKINGHFWGTSRSNPGGGAGWISAGYISKGYLSNFVARHPPGL